MAQTSINLAKDLIRIHKVITRSLTVGSIRGEDYQKTDFPNLKELPGYSSYIHCIAAVLDSHHTAEDLIFFPAFRKVIPSAPYGQLSKDHRNVELLLSSLPQAITDLSENQPERGISTIVKTLGRISEVWYPHIHLEEQHFTEESINSSLNMDEQKNLSEAFSKHNQAHSNPPYWVVPFVLYNLEPDERALMAANLPPTIMSELVPIVWKDQWSGMKPFLLD